MLSLWVFWTMNNHTKTPQRSARKVRLNAETACGIGVTCVSSEHIAEQTANVLTAGPTLQDTCHNANPTNSRS